jgi:hypothetical protein
VLLNYSFAKWYQIASVGVFGRKGTQEIPVLVLTTAYESLSIFPMNKNKTREEKQVRLGHL